MNVNIVLVILASLVSLSSCQRQSIAVSGIAVSWENIGTRTVFNVTGPLANGISINDAWLGVGLNNQIRMANMNAIMCRNGPSNSYVRHNLNTATNSLLMNAANPTFGLSEIRIGVSQGNLFCSFARDNQQQFDGYYQVTPSSSPYLFIAYGTGEPAYHGLNRGNSPNPINFPFSSTTTQPTTAIITSTITTTQSSSSSSSSSSFSSSSSSSASTSSSSSSSSAAPPSSTTSCNNSTNKPANYYENAVKVYVMKFVNWIASLFKPKPKTQR